MMAFQVGYHGIWAAKGKLDTLSQWLAKSVVRAAVIASAMGETIEQCLI
jgi:hypothetical protein